MTSSRVVASAVLLGLLLGYVEHSSAVRPGENGKIAFATARDGNFEIYAVNPDTTGSARLTNHPGTDTDPAWSHDGTRLAFTTTRRGNDDIYLMNADGTGQVQLTSSVASDQNATWSPGGRNLAFVSDRDGDAEIFVMNEDGTGQTQLTRNDGPSDAVPAWSPDGTKIAFSSTRDGNSEIYVMDVDGTDVTRLTSAVGDDVSPSWSPAGDRIAFASNRDGNYEIYVMPSSGGDPARLTRNLQIDLDPAWSPDGRLLTFTTNRDANNEIYVMSSDGSNPTRLTTDQAEDTTPDWQWRAFVPPPPKPVTAASLSGSWRESEYTGVLRLEGRVPGLSRIQLALRAGQRTVLAKGLVVPRGAFSRRYRLPPGLMPRTYSLEVTADGSPTALTAQVIRLRLAAPPEGVVSLAWASATVGGPPLRRVPASNAIAWAHFRLAALPKAGRSLVTTWKVEPRPRQPLRPVPKPRSSPVIAWIRTVGDALPRGTYTCVLSAGKTAVKRLTFRVS